MSSFDVMDLMGGGGALDLLSSYLGGIGFMMAIGIILGIVVFAAGYALDGFKVLHTGRKAGLEKDWMPFVPFAHTIYRLQIVGEQWWKMFFLEWYWFYAWLLRTIVMAISANKWGTFANVLCTIYLLLCLAYNVYYLYKYYRAFEITPVLSILVLTGLGTTAITIIDYHIAFTKNFRFTGEGTGRTISGSLKSAVNVPRSPGAPPVGAAAMSASITGLSGMYAGQDLPLAPNDEMIIGRDSAFCNVIVDQNAEKVSRKHCGILFDQSRNSYQVTDYSTNGTFIDGGNRLVANMPTTLQRGTVIALGSRENRFKLN